MKTSINGINECPYCGGLDFRIEIKSVCAGHGDYGEESYLHCLTCSAKTTFSGYYDQFDKERYNRRTKS